MRTRLHSTLVALATLGGIAHADGAAPRIDDSLAVTVGTSHRGFADNYLVMPAGGELAGQMRFVTAQPVFGAEPLRFSDLAIFTLGGRWSAHRRLELSASVDLLPKQPSYTDEKPWQSVTLGARTPIGRRMALAIGGGGGHLLAHSGMWLHQAVALEYRKPITDFLFFDLAGGGSGVRISAPDASSAFVAEVTASTRILFRAPNGVWAGWLGVAYALPVGSRGTDPTTAMAVDPQPRLDLRIGTVLAVVKQWDVFAEFAVVDRGDLSDPSTRLPILNGGFDQQQFIFGITRHFEGTPRPDPDQALQVGQR